MEDKELNKLPRAERRRLQKYGNTNGRTETFTFDHYVYFYNLAMADALYCELSMNAEQIQNVFIKVNETMSCMRKGYIDINDLHDMINDELGIDFARGVSKECLRK